MPPAQAIRADYAHQPPCPCAQNDSEPWAQGLPSDLQDQVVVPIHFDRQRDEEMLAWHTSGQGADGRPCYCTYQFVLTRLRSDDDEFFYEAPVYAESLTAWRLRDTRWLVHRSVYGGLGCRQAQSSYSFSSTQPR